MNEMVAALLSSIIVILAVLLVFSASKEKADELLSVSEMNRWMPAMETLSSALGYVDSGPDGSSARLSLLLPYQLMKFGENSMGFEIPRKYGNREGDVYMSSGKPLTCEYETIGGHEYVVVSTGVFEARLNRFKPPGGTMLSYMEFNGTGFQISEENVRYGNLSVHDLSANATIISSPVVCLVSYDFGNVTITFKARAGVPYLEVYAS